VADKTERRAAEVGSASEEAWSNPSSVERFLSAIDETVAERLDQQAVRARLAQLQRAAERMPKTTDPDWARLVEELARPTFVGGTRQRVAVSGRAATDQP
jgi:hypothetical protein